MSGRGFFWLLVAAWLALGCATTGARQPQFPAERVPVPDRAGTYSTAARPDGAVGGPGVAELERDVKAALAERGAHAESDGALADAASWFLNEVGQGRNVGASVLEAATRHFGFAGAATAFGAFDAKADAWRELLKVVPANMPVTRYGLCVAPSGRIAALILGSMEASYDPIPRTLEPNQSVTLKGELGARYKFGHVYLTKPNGTVEEKLLANRTLDVTFTLAEAGKYQLEVMGDGATGPVVVSNVPIYVGVPEPPLAGVTGKMIGADEAEKQLLALTNEARRAAGAKPLAPDDELREVALGHSEDMADNDFMGHVSPSTGTPEDRWKRSGILLAEFGENIALADTPEAAHDGLMNSPGHRAVLLNPKFTHVGIAVVEQKDGLVVTFNFGRRVPAAAVPRDAAAVEAGIAALRAAKKLPAVPVDPVYRAGAQAGAGAFADGDDEADVGKAVSTGIQREVNRLRANRGGACSYLIELLDLGQLETVAPLSHPGLRTIGVGAKMRTDGKGSRLSTVILAQGAPCD